MHSNKRKHAASRAKGTNLMLYISGSPFPPTLRHPTTAAYMWCVVIAWTLDGRFLLYDKHHAVARTAHYD